LNRTMLNEWPTNGCSPANKLAAQPCQAGYTDTDITNHTPHSAVTQRSRAAPTCPGIQLKKRYVIGSSKCSVHLRRHHRPTNVVDVDRLKECVDVTADKSVAQIQ
jgi:hypothetical protein